MNIQEKMMQLSDESFNAGAKALKLSLLDALKFLQKNDPTITISDIIALVENFKTT